MRKKVLLVLSACFFQILFVIFCYSNSRYFRDIVNSVTVRKKRVLLVVGIISAPSLVHRRDGIRETWMKFCQTRHDVICKFFMDSLHDMDRGLDQVIRDENAKYRDIEFMRVPRGVNFGRRILWFLEWSEKNYIFDFVLRVDDDVFVCLQRLMFELPHRRERRLYWGHLHCKNKGQVRVDEEFLVLSADLVHEFLRDRDSLLCNPFGDISVSLWLNNVQHVTYFHDERMYHEASSASHQLFEDTSLCHNYLALNRAYQRESIRYWINVSNEPRTGFIIPEVPPFEKVCKLSKFLDWKSFALGHRFEPVRCARKPTWNLLGNMYLGQQGVNAKDKNVLDPLGDDPIIPP